MWLTFLIIVAILLASLKGFSDTAFFESLALKPQEIKRHNAYYRLFSSALLHGDWLHLLFNLLALYSFGQIIESLYGPWLMLLIFMVSLLAGSVVSFAANYNNPEYKSVGASGAISGLIMAFTVLFPNETITMMIIPMPAWLFGALFLGISIFGMIKGKGGIAHDAHLGGAAAGLVFAFILDSTRALEHWLILVLFLVPLLVFGYLYFGPLNWYFKGGFSLRELKKARQRNTIPISRHKAMEEELDDLLDKVRKRGMSGISKEEKIKLDDISKKLKDKDGQSKGERRSDD